MSENPYGSRPQITAKRSIDKVSLETALQFNSSFITKCKAAEILGIQKDSIPKLICAGLLAIKESPTKRAMIYKPDVDKLLELCRGRLVGDEIQGIQFHKALIKYTVNGLSIVKLIKFTQAGILSPMISVANGTLANIFYSELELNKCMSILKLEKEIQDGYCIQDVMQLLHIGEKSLHNLMKLGVIRPKHQFIMKDGRKRYLFEKKTIDAFIKEHLTIEEASIEFNISSSTIRRYLRSGKLTDVMQGVGKKYLISVEELSFVTTAT
ncbi:helix-turn-helix domain-containing protein [Paenibacillus cellulositrophicus]|uniref:helix-turn-helix domain-containing protein n=1 Tax=Paenibacillus cellulositrophicus TaxID=562959 RepID=UPI003F7D1464